MSESPTRFKAPLQVVLMFAIIIATLLLGFFMLPKTQEERDQLLAELGTTNHGLLLNPTRTLADLPLGDSEGNPWAWQQQRPKWRLLIPAGSSCTDDCDQMLYITRQMHLRLAKHANRLERVYLALDGAVSPELADNIKTNHPYLKTLHSNRAAFGQWLAGTNSNWRDGAVEAILVDPSGLAMMVYDGQHSGSDMLEDINHLLKYSPD